MKKQQPIAALNKINWSKDFAMSSIALLRDHINPLLEREGEERLQNSKFLPRVMKELGLGQKTICLLGSQGKGRSQKYVMLNGEQMIQVAAMVSRTVRKQLVATVVHLSNENEALRAARAELTDTSKVMMAEYKAHRARIGKETSPTAYLSQHRMIAAMAGLPAGWRDMTEHATGPHLCVVSELERLHAGYCISDKNVENRKGWLRLHAKLMRFDA